MSDCLIRTMKSEDLEQVCRIEQAIFSEPWSEAGFLSALDSADTIYLVVEKGGEIAGYCGLLRSFDEADITNVAVDAGYRGLGIAKKMLTELMKQGKNAGIERFTLEVRESNAVALHIYEKLGFRSVGIRKRFYTKPVENAVIMWTGLEDGE